jgi:hypothetical protein
LLGQSAIISRSHDAKDVEVAVDVDGLIRRLLLFETYVLYSVRLKEIPALVPYLGYEGLHHLLTSGALEIRCECTQLVEGKFNTPTCPSLTFQFHAIEAHDRKRYVHDCLQNVHHAHGLQHKQVLKLKRAVVEAIRSPDMKELFRAEVAPAFEHELLHNPTLVARAVKVVLAKEKVADGLEFELKVHKAGDDRYEVETDLPRKLNISSDEAHNHIKTGLLAVAGLSQRIAEMKAHRALSGFTDEDLPLFREKLQFLASLANSENQESRFKRVISIAGLPHFVAEKNVRIDIEKLLELRNSPEAREFRDWLSTLDSATDEEIRDRIRGLSAKLGLIVHGTTGKAMRFIVTTAIGFVPIVGPVIGMAAGALDQFLTDKIICRSGITAFVNESYPSLFETK